MSPLTGGRGFGRQPKTPHACQRTSLNRTIKLDLRPGVFNESKDPLSLNNAGI